jgi:ribosome-binding protein aMBF1 (putative translation factor)
MGIRARLRARRAAKKAASIKLTGIKTQKIAAATDKCKICGKTITRVGAKPGVCFGCSTENDWKEKKSATRKVSGSKLSNLRHIAENEPEEMATAIDQLQDIVQTMADSLETLKDGLDLVPADLPKDASVRQKVAARNRYARAFRRIAEEAPEEFAAMLNDFYQKIEEVADKTEILAENTDVELEIPPTQEPEAAENPVEDDVEDSPVKEDEQDALDEPDAFTLAASRRTSVRARRRN